MIIVIFKYIYGLSARNCDKIYSTMDLSLSFVRGFL